MGEPGVSLRTLDDDRTAGGQRGCDLAHRLRDGKVPGREASNRADGLHDHHVAHTVGAGGDNAAVGALASPAYESMMSAADSTSALASARNFALLLGEHLGDFAGAGAHEVGRLAQNLAALERGHFTPGLEALVDGRKRPVEVAPADVAKRANWLAGGGIDHILRLCAGGFNPGAIDVMLKGCVHVVFTFEDNGSAARITLARDGRTSGIVELSHPLPQRLSALQSAHTLGFSWQVEGSSLRQPRALQRSAMSRVSSSKGGSGASPAR